MSEIKILPKSLTEKIMQDDNRSLLTKTRDFISVNYKIILIIIVIIVIIVIANKLYSKYYAGKKEDEPDEKNMKIDSRVETPREPTANVISPIISQPVVDGINHEKTPIDVGINQGKTPTDEDNNICTKISDDIDREIEEIDNELI